MSLHQDLLAELELTMVPSLRMLPEPGMYVPAGESAEGGSCRRSFWCSLKKQQVDVEFERKLFLVFPCFVGVKRCSAFGEPEKVACGRHCLNSEFRQRWPFAVPTARRRPPSKG